MRKFAFAMVFSAIILLSLSFGNIDSSKAASDVNQNSIINQTTDSTNNQLPLPTYDHSLSEELGKLVNSTTFQQLIDNWSPTRRAISKGETLDWPPGPVHGSYVLAYSDGPDPGPPLYGHGQLGSPYNILDSEDNEYTHFHTEDYRAYPDSDEAIVKVEMDDWAIGDVYLTGYSGTCATSYIFVFYSDDPNADMEDWLPLANGYVSFTQQTESVYLGTATTPFKYVAIFAYAYNVEPFTELNDAYVDCISANYVPLSYFLTISTDGHGTTDPEPGGYNTYGETVEVTAIPDENYEFDHWDIDFGNEQSTDNPIYQETWDSDHYLTAYFTYVPPPQMLTISASGGGTTDPEPGDYWYDYGTGVQVNAEGSGFSYWLLDGEYVSTGSSIYVSMNQYHTVEAHFNEALPTCAVTVNAIEASTQSYAETGVYVDTQYVGQTDLIS